MYFSSAVVVTILSMVLSSEPEPNFVVSTAPFHVVPDNATG